MTVNSSKDSPPRAGMRRALVIALSAGLLLAAGCDSTPRVDMDASRDAGLATGQPIPIEFIAVGPEGAPLDESAGAESLSLSEALRLAVTTDPSLQAALARVRVAMADADQARLLPNPVLNVVLRWGPGTPQVEASLVQDFVQALQLSKRSSAADNRLRQAAAEAVVVAIDVSTEVQERYASAQAASTLVPLLGERLSLLDKLVGAAQARLNAGEGRRSDLASLEAERVELRVEIDQAVLDEREHRVRLARLVGQPSGTAAWTLDVWVEPPPSVGDESGWIDAALNHRPEIQAIAWRLRALGDDEAIAQLLPWEGANAGVDVSKDGDTQLGPSVSTPVPIFDTGQARRARLTAEQYEARHEMTLARRKVVEDVRVAYQSLAASLANLSRVRNELIPLQEQRRSLAESAFRAGQVDVTSLLLAEQDLRLAKARSIAVEHRASLSLIRLQRAVGGVGVAAQVSTTKADSKNASPGIGTSVP